MDAIRILQETGFSTLSLGILLFVILVLSSYVKIVTVLGIVKIGLGFNSLPSAFVTTGLALALSLLVMHPTLSSSGIAMNNAQKSAPGTSAQSQELVIEAGLREWKKFLVAHTHPEQLKIFASSALRIENPAASADPAQLEPVLYHWRSLVPAFVVSELKEAFATGLSLFLPFLVLDIFIATLLLAVGYEDLNPLVVAFPFKLLLFVLVDGWSLITSNLVETYVLS